MSSPGKVPITVRIGDTDTITVTIVDGDGAAIDITGRTYAAQIRSTATSGAVLASYTCTVTDGPTGVVTCTLDAATTAELSPVNGVWDLQETNGSTITTLIAGRAVIEQDVTR